MHEGNFWDTSRGHPQVHRRRLPGMLSRFIWRRARTSHGAWTGLIASGCATLTGVAAASGCASYSAEQPAVFDELMELVPTGNGWEWRARPQGKAPPREIKPTTSAPAATASTLAPVVTEPAPQWPGIGSDGFELDRSTHHAGPRLRS